MKNDSFPGILRKRILKKVVKLVTTVYLIPLCKIFGKLFKEAPYSWFSLKPSHIDQSLLETRAWNLQGPMKF